MLQLIIFDCDGVLVDSELLARRAMASVLREAGIPATADTIAPFTGMKQPDILARIAEATDTPMPEGIGERMWPAIRTLFHAELAAVTGIAAFLQRLEIPRCVASSSHPERIRESLALTKLAGYFGDHIFSSHQVKHGKPAPDLFLFAAKNMGAEPAHCVVIEDSVAGVRAAKAAGMRVIAFAGASHADEAHRDALLAEAPTLLIDSYADADAVIEQMAELVRSDG